MEFRNDTANERYVLEVDGLDGPKVVALTQYSERHGRLIFPHTEIDPEYEGHGLGSELVRQALDDVRSQGRMIVPLCPFVRDWIERHPAYDDLVDHELLATYLQRLGN
jgi:predicted GNAT family acetyltransferase